jgi:hypothetical protein
MIRVSRESVAFCRVYLAVESSSTKDGAHGDTYAVARIE